ncbi:TPA: acyl-phosphate glycerol 3-phosphate acyltransferase [Candidatus Acetothermia bacterium]|nr:acyl-phosphate glycerol 3-phosphate acyltransferase [Candidatus Acetothermia bacterium]HAZ30470.1 acyl-phosphate glycerol 3-phosphate acyltransferase [Candidatus Acetothermia bacterium]
MNALSYGIVAVLGYLLGGVPTAYVAGRLRGVDIRRRGSGNVGGTNALRVLGWKVGVGVMALDAAKGYLAVALLPRLPLPGGEPVYLGLGAGAAVVFGHVFSPYLGFRGGKGVATAAGVLLALAPLPVAIASGAFFVVAFGTGFVSLSSMTASVALPLAAFLLDRYGAYSVHPAVLALMAGLAPLVFYTHRANIRRLISGDENRFRRFWEKRDGGTR